MNAGEQPRRRVELDGGIYATVGYEGGHPDRLALYWDGGEFIAAANLSKRARAELAVALMGLPEVVEVGSGHDEQTGADVEFERVLEFLDENGVRLMDREGDPIYYGGHSVEALADAYGERFGSSVSGGD